MTITSRIEQNISPVPIAGCWLWTKGVGSHGYGQMMFPDKRPRLVHRLAYEAYIGAIPAGLYVLHRCDVRSCCNPAHLFVGTQKDNMRDCISKGRNSMPPPKKPNKVPDHRKAQIVDRLGRGESAKTIAADFGVHVSRIHQIARAHRDNN